MVAMTAPRVDDLGGHVPATRDHALSDFPAAFANLLSIRSTSQGCAVLVFRTLLAADRVANHDASRHSGSAPAESGRAALSSAGSASMRCPGPAARTKGSGRPCSSARRRCPNSRSRRRCAGRHRSLPKKGKPVTDRSDGPFQLAVIGVSRNAGKNERRRLRQFRLVGRRAGRRPAHAPAARERIAALAEHDPAVDRAAVVVDEGARVEHRDAVDQADLREAVPGTAR